MIFLACVVYLLIDICVCILWSGVEIGSLDF
jgi:hypothetical protein